MLSLKSIFLQENHLPETFDIDLDVICINMAKKYNYQYFGSIMKDQLKLIPDIDKVFMIINYDKSNQTGSHWVALIKNGRNIFYFDSYAIPPLQKVFDRYSPITNNIYYSNTPIQKTGSNICGQLCIAFFDEMFKKGVTNKSFLDFMNKSMKYSNRYKNDRIQLNNKNVENYLINK
jgi:hypothetical protein